MDTALNPDALRILYLEGEEESTSGVLESLQRHFRPEQLRHLKFQGDHIESELLRADLILLGPDTQTARGVQLLNRLQALSPELPVVMIASSSDPQTLQLALQQNVQDFLTLESIQAPHLDLEVHARLLAARERFRAQRNMVRVLDENPAGVLVISREGFVRYFNQRAQALFSGVMELALDVEFGIPVTSGKATMLQSADGRQIEMHVIAVEWNGQSCWLAMLQDITEHLHARRLLQEQKLHLQQMVDEQTRSLTLARDAAEEGHRTKSEFLSNISHELRTPMVAVLGAAELLEEKVTGDEESAELLLTLQRAGEKMLGLLDNLLDFSLDAGATPDAGNSEFDLGELLSDLVGGFRQRAVLDGLDLDLRIPRGMQTRFRGDAERLRKIVGNLLSNAFNHTDKGSVMVVVTVNPVDGSRYRVHISVKDTGCGIPADHLDKVFQPFNQVDNSLTRKHGGAGLGLSISKQLAEQMGGRIGVISTPGVGSRFWLECNLDAAGSQTDAPVPQVPTLERGPAYRAPDGTRALLVEDDRGHQQTTRELLELLNCTVDVASHGQEAVARCMRDDFDVILMDFNMPLMNGIEATRTIRRMESSRGTHTGIIGLTADVKEATYLACHDSGMDHILSKPIALGALAELLRHCIER